MKARYLVSCAAAAILSGSSVAAQAAGQGQDDTSAGAARRPDGALTVTATDAAADTGTSATVGDIIVTAERRSENIQAVPMTVTAITAKAISQQNITTLDDIVKYTPNVTFGANGPGQGVIFMRGLSAGLQGNQSSATIATYPNVALYLDEQSMQFPGRNVDIYTVDLDRIEVLEGPQGTLFGGGAQAGAIRYITNRPNLSTFSASAEAAYGGTAGGGANYFGNFVLNVPLVKDKLAIRAVVFGDRRGGYITNVASTFTRSNQDLGNTYFNIHPNAANICPNGLPGGGPHDLCALPNAPQANNFQVAGRDSNPVTYDGARVSLLWQVNDDWDVLISQTFQDLDAEGVDATFPRGSDFQPLGPMQITFFSPSFDHDNWRNTAWTVNGKIGPIRTIYTGGWLDRHIDQQMDYTNYSRSTGGMYYECTGGGTGFGNAPPVCFSPVSNWRDIVRNTHLSNELRFTTPDDWRIRGIAGFYQENFRIYDNMNFNYKTIPACNPQNLPIALAGGQVCLADVRPAPGSTANDPNIRSDATAFGEDTQRGYDQLAFFGSVDFDVIPHVLTISAGTRWYQYKEFMIGSQYSTGTECLNVPNGQCGGPSGAGGTVNIDAAHDRTTYTGFKSRANITWHVNQDVMTYFTFSQGFRPGGFNRSVSGVAKGADGKPQFEKPNSYAPDFLDNYEWGLKTQWFDHRLLVNLTGYHMLWQNVQLLFFNPTELGNTTFGVNGPNYEINGGEIQVDARVTDGLTIDGAATYNQARQTTSPCLKGNIPGSPVNGKCITDVLQNGVGLVPFQNPFGLLGSVPPFSPKFEGDLRARYEWDAMDGYRAYVQGGVKYVSSMFNQPATYASGEGVIVPNTTLLRYEMPGYATGDVAVGVMKDNWTAEFYVDNVTNSHASALTSSEQFIKSIVPIRPRVYMFKVGAKF
ncbi:MAG TPA: TonB-dependent receptor [Caulobacteraceae bacterium]